MNYISQKFNKYLVGRLKSSIILLLFVLTILNPFTLSSVEALTLDSATIIDGTGTIDSTNDTVNTESAFTTDPTEDDLMSMETAYMYAGQDPAYLVETLDCDTFPIPTNCTSGLPDTDSVQRSTVLIKAPPVIDTNTTPVINLASIKSTNPKVYPKVYYDVGLYTLDYEVADQTTKAVAFWMNTWVKILLRAGGNVLPDRQLATMQAKPYWEQSDLDALYSIYWSPMPNRANKSTYPKFTADEQKIIAKQFPIAYKIYHTMVAFMPSIKETCKAGWAQSSRPMNEAFRMKICWRGDTQHLDALYNFFMPSMKVFRNKNFFQIPEVKLLNAIYANIGQKAVTTSVTTAFIQSALINGALIICPVDMIVFGWASKVTVAGLKYVAPAAMAKISLEVITSGAVAKAGVRKVVEILTPKQYVDAVLLRGETKVMAMAAPTNLERAAVSNAEKRGINRLFVNLFRRTAVQDMYRVTMGPVIVQIDLLEMFGMSSVVNKEERKQIANVIVDTIYQNAVHSELREFGSIKFAKYVAEHTHLITEGLMKLRTGDRNSGYCLSNHIRNNETGYFNCIVLNDNINKYGIEFTETIIHEMNHAYQGLNTTQLAKSKFEINLLNEGFVEFNARLTAYDIHGLEKVRYEGRAYQDEVLIIEALIRRINNKLSSREYNYLGLSRLNEAAIKGFISEDGKYYLDDLLGQPGLTKELIEYLPYKHPNYGRARELIGEQYFK